MVYRSDSAQLILQSILGRLLRTFVLFNGLFVMTADASDPNCVLPLAHAYDNAQTGNHASNGEAPMTSLWQMLHLKSLADRDHLLRASLTTGEDRNIGIMSYLEASNNGEKSAFTNTQPQSFTQAGTKSYSTLEPVTIDYSTLETIEQPVDKFVVPYQYPTDPEPVPPIEDEPEPKPAPWWKRHLLVIVVSIIIVIGAIVGGVVGGIKSQEYRSSTAASATQTTSTASTPTATSTTVPSPTNNVWLGTVRDRTTNVTTNMAFEVTGASDEYCHYEETVPEDVNPCNRPFTLENNITYTWQGCGGNTWLEYGPDNIFYGNCDFSTQTWSCTGVWVTGSWICGLGR
ncbi:hypothetical protein F4810DRAFT_155985 [Camillea tinctor]|nr:hypothetical protein F4810DRAFT_155985 [Camillea tinctor]